MAELAVSGDILEVGFGSEMHLIEFSWRDGVETVAVDY